MTGCAQLPGRTLTESAAQKTASERRRRRCLVAVIMAENAVHPRRTAGDGRSCGASARIFHAIFCHREPDERERGDPTGRRPATDSAPTPPSGRSRFTATLSAAPDQFSAGACRTSSPGSLQIASAIGGRRTILLPVQRRSFEPWRAPVEPSLPFPSPQTQKPEPVPLLALSKRHSHQTLLLQKLNCGKIRLISLRILPNLRALYYIDKRLPITIFPLTVRILLQEQNNGLI